MTRKAKDGRYIHIWRGDAAALAETIAEATPGLCTQDGGIFQLNEKKELVGIGRNALQGLINQHIAGVRVVKNGAGWQYELYSYEFAPTPHRGPPTWTNQTPGADAAHEPDAAVLDQIYRTELALRLPRVESGAR
jgi:hypothetical protein